MFDRASHDVVITDLGMPRMNGWEVAERVKAQSPDDAGVPPHGLGRAAWRLTRAASSWTAWWRSRSPPKR